MLVKDRMTSEPICGRPDMAVTEAQALMNANKIRHLPILDDNGQLVGLVTQRNLSKALPADISAFSRLEVSYV
ncbi:MAG: CBS domain-containing protein, partial [Anaerolineae bacterium]